MIFQTLTILKGATIDFHWLKISFPKNIWIARYGKLEIVWDIHCPPQSLRRLTQYYHIVLKPIEILHLLIWWLMNQGKLYHIIITRSGVSLDTLYTYKDFFKCSFYENEFIQYSSSKMLIFSAARAVPVPTNMSIFEDG